MKKVKDVRKKVFALLSIVALLFSSLSLDMPLAEAEGLAVTDYASLAAAVEDAAEGSSTEIVLGGETYVVESPIVIENKNIILKNEAGQVAKFVKADFASFPKMKRNPIIFIKEGGNLTLKPSSEENIVFDGEKRLVYQGTGGLMIDVGGKLVMDGGLVENARCENVVFGGTIKVSGKKASMTMNSGIIRNNTFVTRGSCYSSSGIYANNEAKITINGGQISDNKNSIYKSGSYYFNQPFFGNVAAAPCNVGGIMCDDGADLEMNGGLVKNNMSAAGGCKEVLGRLPDCRG